MDLFTGAVFALVMLALLVSCIEDPDIIRNYAPNIPSSRWLWWATEAASLFLVASTLLVLGLWTLTSIIE